jgi:hypothetical protein
MMIYFVIILAIAARFIPHMPNFAPITALAIFSAANLGWKKATALTLAARFVSDWYIGFFAWPLMLAVYAAHLAGVLLGVWIGKSQKFRWPKIVSSSLFASVIFFLLTNFAFLYRDYPHTWAGITLAYTNGLPFFRGTLLGDLGYTVALFGAYGLARYLAARKTAVFLKNSLM